MTTAATCGNDSGFGSPFDRGALFFALFVRVKDVPEPLPISPTQHLEDRKHAIYDSLRDLQFEYRVGKLSDGDYQQNKLALQRELAGVLAGIEELTAKLGVRPGARAVSKPTIKSPATVCPHCGAKFKQALKFCGECGKAIG